MSPPATALSYSPTFLLLPPTFLIPLPHSPTFSSPPPSFSTPPPPPSFPHPPPSFPHPLPSFPCPTNTLSPTRWNTTILVDESRTLYRQWGLPESASWLPAGGPLYLVQAYRLGKEEGIWGTGPIEGDATGTRAQMGGAFAVDAGGVVRWYALSLLCSPGGLVGY